MGTMRIVKNVSTGLSWLEIDGLMIRIEDECLLVKHNGETLMIPCEVIYENDDVTPFKRGEN